MRRRLAVSLILMLTCAAAAPAGPLFESVGTRRLMAHPKIAGWGGTLRPGPLRVSPDRAHFAALAHLSDTQRTPSILRIAFAASDAQGLALVVKDVPR